MFKEPKFYVDFDTEGQLKMIQLLHRSWEHVADIKIQEPTRQTMRQAAGNSWESWIANDPKINPNQIVNQPGFVHFYRKPNGVSDETWHNCHVYFRAVRDVIHSLFMNGKF